MTQYITKIDLSNGPQFGSQMTQYAGLYAVSKKLNAKIAFTRQQLNIFRKVKLFEAFDITDEIVDERSLNLSQFMLQHNTLLDTRVFTLDKNKNWDIRGHFHTYHYFHEYENEIRDVFTFKQHIVSESKEKINSIKNDEPYPLVSLHVRRGDYLAVSSLNLQNKYYSDAINLFIDKLDGMYFKVVVFSDDIAWCKQNILGENVFYSEDNSNYVDMCMMSMCDHHIIANSTFSWWGAFLNSSQNKIVVCPREYVGGTDATHQLINGNYYPDTWTSISTL